MICKRTRGVTMMSRERPKRLRGSARVMRPGRLGWAAGSAAAGSSAGLEDIARSSHGLQVAWEARILLDLAPEPRHLHVDGAQIAAELPLLGQRLARDRRAGVLGEAGEQRRLRRGEMDRFLAAEKLAALAVEAKGAEADLALALGGIRRPPLEDVADAQHQLGRFEGLGQGVVSAALQRVDAVLGL